jgi:hypothetical protein
MTPFFKKNVPNGPYYLQRAVTPDWWAAFSIAEKPSEDVNSRLFLINKKGLKGNK